MTGGGFSWHCWDLGPPLTPPPPSTSYLPRGVLADFEALPRRVVIFVDAQVPIGVVSRVEVCDQPRGDPQAPQDWKGGGREGGGGGSLHQGLHLSQPLMLSQPPPPPPLPPPSVPVPATPAKTQHCPYWTGLYFSFSHFWKMGREPSQREGFSWWAKSAFHLPSSTPLSLSFPLIWGGGRSQRGVRRGRGSASSSRGQGGRWQGPYHGADHAAHVSGVPPAGRVSRRVLAMVETQVQEQQAEAQDVLLELQEGRAASGLSSPSAKSGASPPRPAETSSCPSRAVCERWQPPPPFPDIPPSLPSPSPGPLGRAQRRASISGWRLPSPPPQFCPKGPPSPACGFAAPSPTLLAQGGLEHTAPPSTDAEKPALSGCGCKTGKNPAAPLRLTNFIIA